MRPIYAVGDLVTRKFYSGTMSNSIGIIVSVKSANNDSDNIEYRFPAINSKTGFVYYVLFSDTQIPPCLHTGPPTGVHGPYFSTEINLL